MNGEVVSFQNHWTDGPMFNRFGQALGNLQTGVRWPVVARQVAVRLSPNDDQMELRFTDISGVCAARPPAAVMRLNGYGRSP